LIKIQEGTARFFKSSPCNSCQSAVIVKGQAESELIVRCYELNRELPFIVSECSSYNDKNAQNVRAMESLAWILNTNEKNKVGFSPPSGKKPRFDDFLDD
jgi:hypothetical protein